MSSLHVRPSVLGSGKAGVHVRGGYIDMGLTVHWGGSSVIELWADGQACGEGAWCRAIVRELRMQHCRRCGLIAAQCGGAWPGHMSQWRHGQRRCGYSSRRCRRMRWWATGQWGRRRWRVCGSLQDAFRIDDITTTDGGCRGVLGQRSEGHHGVCRGGEKTEQNFDTEVNIS